MDFRDRLLYRTIIYALFLGSGVAALVYQVLWTRLLTLTFGVTTLAVSTVLTCFFGGLALGSFLGGRFVDRRGRGLRWYGVAEIVVGLYALFFSTFLSLNNGAYVWMASSLEAGFYGQSITKFVLAAMLLIVPTTMMGATLPILSKTLASSYSRFARDIGSLYSINTLGAVLGAFLTGFVLIPAFGVKAVIYAVGAANITMGLVALWLERGFDYNEVGGGGESFARVLSSAVEEGEEAEGERESEGGVSIGAGFTSLVVWGFAVSGFTALAYEVIWTKVLGFILTGTIYAFSTVLTVFLAGIAVGSFLVSRLIDRFSSTGSVVRLLALTEVLIGLSSAALIILYAKMPGFDLYKRITSTPDFSEFLYLNFSVSFVLLFLPAFLFGATFPLVCKIYGRRMERVGESIGNVYSINTVGGILGSFAGGFILIEFIGMQTSLLVMAALNVGLGMLFFYYNPHSTGTKRSLPVILSGAAAVIVFLLLPPNMPRALHESLLRNGERILFYGEGPAATVMIAERTGATLEASNKRLWVNGNMATAAYYEGLKINRFQGVLPMVLHPDPKEVLVICFGSGTTFGTLSSFDVERVDNVEIAKTVIKGAPFFKSENRDVLNNPVSKITIDDGRSFLEVTKNRYDVITEEPMHPSLAGVVNLYTKEYYELARDHLKEGGIMSQWIPLYNLSVEDVRMLSATFRSVFPHVTVWIANTDIFMIGSMEALPLDYEQIVERISRPEIKRLLREVDLEDPAEFFSTFVMANDRFSDYTKGALLVTDDFPLVEFTGPRSLAVNTISPNIGELIEFREPVFDYLYLDVGLPPVVTAERFEQKFDASLYNLVGRAYFADSNFSKANEYFSASLRIDPTDRVSLHYKQKFGLLRKPSGN